MSMKFLDDTGLTHFWAKIKAHVLQNGIFYGTCSTAKGTVAKVATVAGVTELKTGITIAVKFTNENTSTSPTLKVNSLDAKAIKRYGTTAVGTSAAASWQAGAVVTMTYDGTNWVAHDWNNTTYSSMSVAEYEAGTSTSTRVITPARLKGAISYWAQEKLVSGTNIKTINNTSLLGSGDISISSGLEPLIGDTTNIVPLQVKNALREGRTVCLQDDGSLAGVDLDLRFTTWNGATDTVYSGAAIDIVASQTVAYYSGTYYLFELVGTVGGGWELFSTSLAEQSDIPTVPTNVSDFNNDAGYITSETDPVFSASAASGITSTNISTWNGKYSKPSGGIPKTDLASAVQTSLGKADTALQSYTETDPTVPSWAKASTKPTYTASEVGALPASTPIFQPSVAQAKSTGANKSLAAGTITQVDLSTINTAINSSASISGGGLKISEAGTYKVTASIYVSSTTNAVNGYGVYVRKGSAFSSATEIGSTLIPKGTGYSHSGCVQTTFLCDVSANDILFLAGRLMSGTGTLNQDHISTFILIEKLA